MVLAVSGGIAQAALDGSGSAPAPKPLDRAVLDALRAPEAAGVSARIEFTNGLLPGGSLPDNGGASPLATGAEGRLWVAGDGRFRLELQSDAGDAQIADDGERLTAYDPASETVYTMPSHAAKDEREGGDEPTLADVRRGLDRIAEAWTLSGAQPGTTGGQPSYTVRIAPKDDGGLLGAAELAWDAARGVPLRAAVFAQGDEQPVLELEATDVEYGKLPASALSADPAGRRARGRDRPADRRRDGRAGAPRARPRRRPAARRLHGRRAGRAGRAPAPERAARAQRRRRRRAQRLRRGHGRDPRVPDRRAGARAARTSRRPAASSSRR